MQEATKEDGKKYWTNCKPSFAYAVAIFSQLEGIFTLKGFLKKGTEDLSR